MVHTGRRSNGGGARCASTLRVSPATMDKTALIAIGMALFLSTAVGQLERLIASREKQGSVFQLQTTSVAVAGQEGLMASYATPSPI